MPTIWLSATGCDLTGDGSRKRPVATLARAVELTRAAGSGKRRIAVETGVYADTSATLEAVDSGLEITAAEGAAPFFCGGAPVTGWRRESPASKFWVAPLPGVREGTRDFRALVVNDRFAPRARHSATSVAFCKSLSRDDVPTRISNSPGSTTDCESASTS